MRVNAVKSMTVIATWTCVVIKTELQIRRSTFGRTVHAVLNRREIVALTRGRPSAPMVTSADRTSAPMVTSFASRMRIRSTPVRPQNNFQNVHTNVSTIRMRMANTNNKTRAKRALADNVARNNTKRENVF